MRKIQSAIATLSVVLLLGGANPAAAQFYSQHNLASDVPGLADLTEPSLVNAWGLVSSTTSPFWVSNNGTGTSTLFNGNTGAKVPIGSLPCLCVSVPGAPTGVVFNGIPFTSGTGFVVTDPLDPSKHAPARFIFASEDGAIFGWAPNVPPGPNEAIVAVQPSDANVYKGLAIATTAAGEFLYATNFHAGTVDVYDTNFMPFSMGPAAFIDRHIPKGYAPFGIRNINGVIFVTYALQDADAHDDVPGMGHGFINAFDTEGHFLGRVASRGTLNSPWGLALAPADFGKFGDDLLVGNFGDGRIHAYDLADTRGNGEFKHRGVLHSAGGPPLAIDGLWGLSFGNGATAGPMTTLFFTAGPAGESHGLFGSLVAVPPPGKQPDDDPDED
jgi:uncharacterized protein (TIGR03118 family)